MFSEVVVIVFICLLNGLASGTVIAGANFEGETAKKGTIWFVD
ncbi:MAG: hypothetical protein ACON4R_10730 [Akkermansiaceae bacterium]